MAIWPWFASNVLLMNNFSRTTALRELPGLKAQRNPWMRCIAETLAALRRYIRYEIYPLPNPAIMFNNYPAKFQKWTIFQPSRRLRASARNKKNGSIFSAKEATLASITPHPRQGVSGLKLCHSLCYKTAC
jgi:hypothetical protein